MRTSERANQNLFMATEIETIMYGEMEVVTFISARNELAAIAFDTKRKKKPSWRYRFNTVKQRTEFIEQQVSKNNIRIARKQAEKQKQRAAGNHYKVGDILSSSWGYGQTNIDFFQVVRATGKSVEIREISSRTVYTTGYDDYLEPNADDFISESLGLRRSCKDYIKVDYCRQASKWDGKPCRQTGANFGH